MEQEEKIISTESRTDHAAVNHFMGLTEPTDVDDGASAVAPLDLEGSAPVSNILTTNTMGSNNYEKRPKIFKNLAHEIVTVAVLAMAPALTSLNNGGLLIALPKIGDEFHVHGGTLGWTLSATSLATGAVLLFMGQLADTIGRRRLLLASYIWFTFMSLGGGLVRNPTGFFILRAMQGISGASAVPSAVGIIGAGYMPGKRKNRAMATFSAGAPIGFVIGVIVGGICSEILNWHSILYFYSILYGLTSIIGFVVIPKDAPIPREEFVQKLKSMDYGGIVLAISGLTLFIFSLSQWNNAVGGWGNTYIICCLVIGVVLMVSFVIYEVYIPARPIMPMYLWKNVQFCLTMTVGACGWMLYVGVLAYYATLYFQDLRHASAILTTAYYVPQAIMGILINVFAALVLHKIPGKILLMIAMGGFFASSLLWSFVDLHTSYWALPFPAFLLIVVGLDLAYNICNMHILSQVGKNMQSTAAGIFNTVLQISSAIGLSISTGIVAAKVPDNATPEQTMMGYRAAYQFALAIASLGLLLSFFVRIGVQGGKHQKKEAAEKAARGED